MTKTKEIFINGLALFSMFFGAGNLILPPFLGFKAGNEWFLVTLGFVITAVIIPIFGIMAHARLQGTMYDFGKMVSPVFSRMYCIVVYIIAIALPAPRTASVTHEMAIQPFFNTHSLITSSIYFILVFLFVLNRSKIITFIGKFLTPLIVLILLGIIGIGLFAPHEIVETSKFTAPLVSGLLEGYQTFDAIGAVVVGGVIIISLKLGGNRSYEFNKELIRKSGFVAGLGLFLIYGGLILNGALFHANFEDDVSRTEVLSGLSTLTLGNTGTTFLSVLVALACFTTAVGIIIGAADYFKGLFNESKRAYIITAAIGSILGIVIGQFNVHDIIGIALPALMFIYPITIVLIFLNVLPKKFVSGMVFKSVVLVAFIFSIPDFLAFLTPEGSMNGIKEIIPLANYNLGWLLPALGAFLIVNLLRLIKKSIL